MSLPLTGNPTSGAWISFSNRMIHRERVALLLLSMATGSAMVALEHSVVMTVVGCLLVGAVMAPLSTIYSVAVEDLPLLDKRAEALALLRTANSFDLVLATAMLTWATLEYGLVLGMAFSTIALMAATGAIMAGPRAHPQHYNCIDHDRSACDQSYWRPPDPRPLKLMRLWHKSHEG
ncbi:hypothetical protein [Rhizobium paranaense]|uniref:MFS transporter n=2 Tax=Rhizobium TaxID=379 RepID=A0A7W8XS79_9HYPH|nr:hypothetical protein [Rhizobium paranaense]MBB5574633.1 hypothetical protein [Rhizobium paranaense]